MGAEINPNVCPLCGGPNACGEASACRIGQGKAECWCTNLKIAPETLARVPNAARNLVCICARCAAAATPSVGPEPT